MEQACKKGFLITLEGIDGSGKTTLSNKLADWFLSRKKPVVKTFEFGDSKLGQTLRTILHTQKNDVCDKAEFLLIAADRAQHFHEIVVPALVAGHIVISDRMADSSLAYQGYGRNLDRSLIQTVNAWVMQGIVPDCTIYLKLDPALVVERVTVRQDALTSFEKEKRAFWQRVSNGYDEIFATRTNVITIDASLAPDIIFEIAVSQLVRLLGNHCNH